MSSKFGDPRPPLGWYHLSYSCVALLLAWNCCTVLEICWSYRKDRRTRLELEVHTSRQCYQIKKTIISNNSLPVETMEAKINNFATKRDIILPHCYVVEIQPRFGSEPKLEYLLYTFIVRPFSTKLIWCANSFYTCWFAVGCCIHFFQTPIFLVKSIEDLRPMISIPIPSNPQSPESTLEAAESFQMTSNELIWNVKK